MSAYFQHIDGRAKDIARRLKDAGYDGVFFDTTTVESVHAEARRGANWDLSETLITGPRDGSCQLRPWNDPQPGSTTPEETPTVNG